MHKYKVIQNSLHSVRTEQFERFHRSSTKSNKMRGMLEKTELSHYFNTRIRPAEGSCSKMANYKSSSRGLRENAPRLSWNK